MWTRPDRLSLILIGAVGLVALLPGAPSAAWPGRIESTQGQGVQELELYRDAARRLCDAQGVRGNAWYDMDLADEIVALHGKADVIVAQNELGHVDDAVAFLRAAKRTLDPGGVLIVEVPRLDALLDKVAFDQIYHEHLSYWTLMALRYAAERAGLTLWRVNLLAVQGGSYRFWFRPGGASDQSVWDRVEVERQFGLGSARPYARFNAQVNAAMRKLADLLEWLDGKRLVGYGAAAKGTVLLNEMRRLEMPLPIEGPG